MAEITNSREVGIGGASQSTGVNIETIRYYERIGLVQEPKRTRGGTRRFDHVALKRLAFIKRCRELGFGVEDIRVFLSMVDRNVYSCAEVHELTVSHLVNVRQKISDLSRLETVLDELAAKCGREPGNVPECPIIEALFHDGTR